MQTNYLFLIINTEKQYTTNGIGVYAYTFQPTFWFSGFKCDFEITFSALCNQLINHIRDNPY